MHKMPNLTSLLNLFHMSTLGLCMEPPVIRMFVWMGGSSTTTATTVLSGLLVSLMRFCLDKYMLVSNLIYLLHVTACMCFTLLYMCFYCRCVCYSLLFCALSYSVLCTIYLHLFFWLSLSANLSFYVFLYLLCHLCGFFNFCKTCI